MREVCEPVSSKGGSSFTYFPVWSAAINFCHELTTQQVWGDRCLRPLIVQGPSYSPISKTFLITLGFAVSESPQHVAFEPHPLA